MSPEQVICRYLAANADLLTACREAIKQNPQISPMVAVGMRVLKLKERPPEVNEAICSKPSWREVAEFVHDYPVKQEAA